jgi:hypothetical protein
LLRVALTLTLLAGAAAGVGHLWRLSGGGWRLSTLGSWETLERKLEAQAFLARRETIVAAPVEGVARFSVVEGERVRPGQELASLVDLADRRQLERQLADVEQKLRADEARHQEVRDQLAAELARAEVDLQGSLGALGRSALGGDAGGLGEAWSGAVASAGARARVSARIVDQDRERDELLAKREVLLQTMSDTGHVVLAPDHGFVSLTIDGLEDFLPSKLSELSAWEVMAMRPPARQGPGGRRLAVGEPLCKLADPAGLTAAIVVSAGQAARLQPGQRVTVRFPAAGEGALRATVTMVGPREKTGYSLVLLETEGVLPALLSARWVQCEVLELSRSGVVIPRAALTTSGGTTGVLVISRTSAYFKSVTVLASVGGRALVDGISAGTVVAMYPWVWRLLGRVRDAQ